MKTDPILYCANGTQKTVAPKNKKNFSLQELQSFVGGYIEMVFISDSLVMVVNEEGKFEELPINVRATEIIRQAGIQDTIAGDALVCSSKLIK
ncbi:MAG: DUF3846 domain-containing protein [Prevotellaceae bacterium]|jgi:hypothetical protein|nr:DUF3846 domain-containing protein [Prevotellaceae bacterium]